MDSNVNLLIESVMDALIYEGPRFREYAYHYSTEGEYESYVRSIIYHYCRLRNIHILDFDTIFLKKLISQGDSPIYLPSGQRLRYFV